MYGIIALIIVLDCLSVIGGFKEAWGYSQESYHGIIKLFGKRFDHAPWIIERGLIFLLPVLSFFFLGDTWELTVVLVSWAMRFILIHQFSYNLTMVYFNKPGYQIGIKESKNTTAKKTTSLFKIILFIAGILVPVLFLILT